MLAMVVNDNSTNLIPRGVLRFIASMLAPTVDLRCYVDVGSTNRPCRGEPARDSGVTVDDMLKVMIPSRTRCSHSDSRGGEA
jgi:hypothetical protein